MAPQAHLIGIVGGVLLLIGVMMLRISHMRRGRRLNPERLWIVPVLMIASCAMILSKMPPPAHDWVWLALALAAGSALGWVRGRTMAIAFEPDSNLLNVKATPAALYFLVVLIGIRLVMRGVLLNAAPDWHLDAVLVPDLFIFFAVGLLVTQRLEMALRARALLNAARPTGP